MTAGEKKRVSWDTFVKHLTRHGLLEHYLTSEQIKAIPSSNRSRWKHENPDKYKFCELNQFLESEAVFLQKLQDSQKIKELAKAYFIISEALQLYYGHVKGIKKIARENKELIVNTIDQIKDVIPVNTALDLFQISRATFQHYKTTVIYKCDNSYFEWCSRSFPQQLIPSEIRTIKQYLDKDRYRYWSKSSIYALAVRKGAVKCSLATFYKYSQLLGYSKRRHLQRSIPHKPLRTSSPNEFWCADVTIFKTADNQKYYLHFLMDHYSRFILGYRIGRSSSGKLIREMLQESYAEYKPQRVQFLTDGGSENCNTTVAKFVQTCHPKVIHQVAQRDVVFSNSMIEMFNKTIKHQFLFPLNLGNGTELKKALKECVTKYNEEKPQWALMGNTPIECFSNQPIDFKQFKATFKKQQVLRIQENQKPKCQVCLSG